MCLALGNSGKYKNERDKKSYLITYLSEIIFDFCYDSMFLVGLDLNSRSLRWRPEKRF